MQRRGGRTGSIFSKSQANLRMSSRGLFHTFNCSNPDKFYMRCVSNFIIQAAQRDVIPKMPSVETSRWRYDSDEQLFMCCGCKQVYWWVMPPVHIGHSSLSTSCSSYPMKQRQRRWNLRILGGIMMTMMMMRASPAATPRPAPSWNWHWTSLHLVCCFCFDMPRSCAKDNVSRVSAPIPATYSGSDSADDQKASCFQCVLLHGKEKSKSKSRAAFKPIIRRLLVTLLLFFTEVR